MKTIPLCLALLLALAARQLFAAEKIRVSSFSTILTEIAQQVGDERVEVTAHVQPGVDPHDFEPKPADLRTVSRAELVLLSAKHMEGYVNKLEEATGGKGNFLQVGDGFVLADEGRGGRTVEDPHWWHSITNVQRATKIVHDALIKISPSDAPLFNANAAAYIEKLETLEKWVKRKLAELPRNKRKLVTSHDAFQYFAKENGFTVYPVEGISSADQPSSKRVSELIRTIKDQGVKAVFTESLENPKVLEEITRETGAKVGGKLYADGLGEGDAGTYEGMYKHNVSTIVDALK
jgi:ABC-type Zn uptake system ZnuABC Zn-binding protein ZnuA